jgi:two-component system, OmpR family, KDP operon response regulator KdpE
MEPWMNEIPSSVLVVDDEPMIRRSLRAGFELKGFVVQEAETGAEALRLARLKPRDLITIDLGLPDMDGADIVRNLRTWSSVPLIVVSVRANEAEKVRLLELGADDYVVKPFGMAELLARARAAMRRRVRTETGPIDVTLGELTLRIEPRMASIRGEEIPLTQKEFRLLHLLAQHAGNVVTHQYLLKEIWGPRHLKDTHYLRMLVRKLRQKIEKDPVQPRILVTAQSMGYRLVASEAGGESVHLINGASTS